MMMMIIEEFHNFTFFTLVHHTFTAALKLYLIFTVSNLFGFSECARADSGVCFCWNLLFTVLISLCAGTPDFNLSKKSDMVTIARAMSHPNSGLSVRDRMWLKIPIPNSFIGSFLINAYHLFAPVLFQLLDIILFQFQLCYELKYYKDSPFTIHHFSRVNFRFKYMLIFL